MRARLSQSDLNARAAEFSRPRWRALGLFGGSVLGVTCVACAPPVAHVSDASAIVAGVDGAAFVEQERPRNGSSLLSTASAPKPCLTEPAFQARFGDVCSHETENQRVESVGELEAGIPEPTPEVRWYCADKLVVRVVLKRCDASGQGNLDGLTPTEIAVVTHAGGS